MAIHASLPLVASEASSPPPTTITRGLSAPPADEPWVEFMRRAGLVGFPAVVVFCVLVPWLAGRIFWTIAIASLPLFFVLAGYHRWRRICPLAFTAQLTTRFGKGGRRRAGRWLQTHFYHVSFGMLFVSLWLRLVATNGDGYALAVFLVVLAGIAFTVDSQFTGKTWCNYVCPISFVEKIYTEPRNLRPTVNSQCVKCTACKPACPDINEENSYWKEVLLPAKRDVYFAFPGLVFAFYFFYYVQAGTWAYYFGGRWTNQIGMFRTAFLPGVDATTAGFYFWPALPRAIGAVVTLAAGAAASFIVFLTIEGTVGAWLLSSGRAEDKAAVRHIMFTLAGFTAFVTFYSYAGAPTLRLLPGAPHFFQLLVVTTATLFLTRRLVRRQTAFAEETLARQIIAKWPWKDTPPPHDLREAFLIHRVRSQSNEEARTRALEMYKEAVRDTINSGIVSRIEVHRLETIRDQMHISPADHERIMAELAEEERGVPGALVVSPEKQLQLETYGRALGALLARQQTRSAAPDPAVLRALREEYAVSEEEHAAVLDRLVQRNEGLAAHLIDAPVNIEMACCAVPHVERIGTPAAKFLAVLLRRRSERIADGLLHTVYPDAVEAGAIREGLISLDPAERSAAMAKIAERMSPALAERLTSAPLAVREEAMSAPDVTYCLRKCCSCPEPYIRASALYTLESLDVATEADYAGLENDECSVVREVATSGLRMLRGDTDHLEPTEIVKMIGLKAIQMFEELNPEDLAELARQGREVWFAPGEALCREGEAAHEIYVLLDGEVSIVRRDGGVDRVIGTEGSGSVIGEMAILDPAPRRATVLAGDSGVRTLRLDGGPFRQALAASPAVAEVIIRMLARRLRAQTPSSQPTADSTL